MIEKKLKLNSTQLLFSSILSLTRQTTRILKDVFHFVIIGTVYAPFAKSNEDIEVDEGVLVLTE